MKKILFSVVIPIYKAEKYLEKCVTSVLEQSYDDFELILVDDGSPDKSSEMCDFFSTIDERVKVIHKANGGSVSARKVGVENASGEYIVFLDSDDWIEKELLNDLKTIILEKRPSTVVYGYKLFFNNQLTICYQNAEEGLYYGNSKEKLCDFMISKRPFFTFGIYPTLWTTCTKREIVLDVQKDVPNEITLGDDASIVYACLLQSNSIYVSKITGCVYRDNDQSMTHACDKMMDKRISILADYITSCMRRFKLRNFDQLNDYLTFMTIQVVGNYLLNCNFNCSKNESMRIVDTFLNQSLIKDALLKCDTSSSSCPIQARVKIFLLRRRWIGLYVLLAKLFSVLRHLK